MTESMDAQWCWVSSWTWIHLISHLRGCQRVSRRVATDVLTAACQTLHPPPKQQRLCTGRVPHSQVLDRTRSSCSNAGCKALFSKVLPQGYVRGRHAKSIAYGGRTLLEAGRKRAVAAVDRADAINLDHGDGYEADPAVLEQMIGDGDPRTPGTRPGWEGVGPVSCSKRFCQDGLGKGFYKYMSITTDHSSCGLG